MEPVMTTSGLVQGYELDGVHIWRGIPYASTPRFRKPEPYRWEGVFDATRGELDGYQQKAFLDEGKLFGDTFYYNEFKSPINYAYSDDFVTLNIVAPKEARDCPVIAFIHGGSFEVGNIAELPYGLTKEYAKRDVILVSIGYRLNVFALYRGGNYGLHDMAAAVDWLYDNIASFGGDPKRITLMGQSAGAMSITDLLYSHRLKGKVFAAITMSGGGMIPRGFSPWTKEQCQGFWDKVMAESGCKTEEEMEKLPPQPLWEAWDRVKKREKSLQAIMPVIDGEIIPDLPQEVFKARGELDVPIMVGVTSQDFIPVILYEIGLSWGLDNEKKGKSPVYGYFFDRTVPGGRFKAYHGCDLWYLFGQMEKSWRPFEEQDYALAARMMDYAANFARTGDPNGGSLPRWRPLSRKQKGFRLFDGRSDGHIPPGLCRFKVWKTMLWDRGPM